MLQLLRGKRCPVLTSNGVFITAMSSRLRDVYVMWTSAMIMNVVYVH